MCNCALSDEIKEQILKAGIRKLERESGVSHHTIDRILKGRAVRRATLRKDGQKSLAREPVSLGVVLTVFWVARHPQFIVQYH